MSTGKKITQARKKAGLSSAQLSRELGKDKSTICRWEKNVVVPSLKSCCLLISIFEKYNVKRTIQQLLLTDSK